MKKFLSLVLAFCMLISCASVLSACGGSDNENPHGSVSKREWEKAYDSSEFSIEATESYLLQSGDVSSLSYKANGGNEEVRVCYVDQQHGVEGGQSLRVVWYIKEVEENQVTYVKRFGTGNNETITPISEEDYNDVATKYVELVNYVRNNYDAFTLKEGSSAYVCDMDKMEEQTSLVSKIGMTSMYVGRFQNTVQDHHMKILFSLDGNVGYRINFIDSIVKDIENLTNYTIKGGPSSSDPDYCEYYVTENGFRVYTPNISDVTKNDGYFGYDAEKEKYMEYRKNENGVWTKSEMVGDYNAILNEIIDIYFPFADYYYAIKSTENGYEQCREITKKTSTYTYNYYDVKIDLDENGNVKSAAWKMKLTLGQAESLEYKMTLVAGNAVINYPSAGK